MNKSLLGVLSALILLTGCATSRSTLDISAPKTTSSAPSNGREVYVNTANDKRVFETSPKTPNIPSLDPSEAQGGDVKARAVARKRNGFGKALGDVLLPAGNSVEALTTAAIRQAFVKKGYRVIEDKAQVTSNTQMVNADIQQFWSWLNLGFWTLSISTEISTPIDIRSQTGDQHLDVSIKHKRHFQTGAEGNWIQTITEALVLYTDDLSSKIK